MLDKLTKLQNEYIRENIEIVTKVYNALADDKSRQVFVNRLLFNYLGDFSYIEELANTNNNILKKHPYVEFYNLYKNIKGNNREIIYYGIGRLLEDQYQLWGDERCFNYQLFQAIEWTCFCDGNPEKTNTMYEGYKIISKEELLSNHKDAYVVLGTYCYNEQIRKELVALGISEEQILEFPYPKDDNFVEFDSFHQYFDDEILNPVSEECFVDCGCFLCDTVQEFIRWNPNYKQIVAYEPEKKQYEMSQRILEKERIKNVKLFNGGVYSSTCKMSLLESGGGSMLLEGEGDIKVYALSDLDLDSKVTLIKMDIEGSELEALKGAENLIKRDRPRLAICVYHKRKDPVEIANWILELGMDYKLYMRHYSNFGFETVLYAV